MVYGTTIVVFKLSDATVQDARMIMEYGLHFRWFKMLNLNLD